MNPQDHTTIAASVEMWDDVVDALWAMSHKAAKWGAPIRAERYKRAAEKLETHLFCVKEPG